MKILSFIVLTFLIASPSISFAGLRGLPEGKSKVEIGDKAPLETEDLKRAHAEGKAIALMFGNPDHCIYCEKSWGNIQALMPQYGNDIAPILIVHRASKFLAPSDTAAALGEIYGVIGEPWLFLIDKDGIVRHIFVGLKDINQIEMGFKDIVKLK